MRDDRKLIQLSFLSTVFSDEKIHRNTGLLCVWCTLGRVRVNYKLSSKQQVKRRRRRGEIKARGLTTQRIRASLPLIASMACFPCLNSQPCPTLSGKLHGRLGGRTSQWVDSSLNIYMCGLQFKQLQVTNLKRRQLVANNVSIYLTCKVNWTATTTTTTTRSYNHTKKDQLDMSLICVYLLL